MFREPDHRFLGIRALLPAIGVGMLLVGGARAEGIAEPVGRVLRLPTPPGAHWVWVEDLLLHRSALFDGDRGRFLGMLSAGIGISAPIYSRDAREIYLVETHYARGTRGERTDVVTVYDAATLGPVQEVVIPPKRAEYVSRMAASALSDDGRFLAVFNLTPATSLSIVDVEERRFVGEIVTPGCSLVYAAGERRFAMVCGDGSLLTVALDADGAEAGRSRSEPFFDPQADPVTEKAVRHRGTWLFVSFEGVVHPVDASGPAVGFDETWSLLSDAERAASWRVGGAQHLAVHEGTGRLYSLVHQGGPDTHKDPGTEVWIYDLESRKRIQRVEVRNPAATFLSQLLELEGGGPGARLADWLLRRLVPNPGADRILVSRDDQPVLFVSSAFPSTLAVHDALSGEFLRDLEEVGVAGSLLQGVP